ncbi:DNA polymerase subunit gamma-2, mitochondrial [Drosophila grimshawi]|uniref:GH10616 n=1 Tax=Drosophila grimshawi TaxID=7222 RepID=B4JCX7_DROGR|nr:DNA polymerase subunit gamma-2, mitochondrial [Drosophila grimshawi]EDW03216.1 GH10616 [Drosophila grimshawi]
MSTRLSRCLKSLESSGFLRATQNEGISSIELLEHGAAYAQRLREQWLNMRQLAANLGSVSSKEFLDQQKQQRFSFVHSQQFQKHLQQLRQAYPSKAKCPTLLKYQLNCATNSSSASSSNSIFKQQQNANVTRLITDFFVEPHRGLEHFYNVQRESKIWWMRYSSNPSRYSIVPYTSQAELEQMQGYQAIDIKAGFGEAGDVTVEQLSLVPLPDEKHFHLPDGHTGQLQLPVVIRSIIELESATCALLLDGCDHGRETHSLLLNRMLAPYQCSIAGIQKTEKSSPDLLDLCAHLMDVLQRSRLRLPANGFDLIRQPAELVQQLQLYDCLGVPYALLLNEQQSLSNGLLQLRSRDTQLAETIHISDLPDYLLNIFRNY